MIQDFRAKESAHENSGIQHHHHHGNRAFAEELSRVLDFYHIDQQDLDDTKLISSRNQYHLRTSLPSDGVNSKLSNDGYVVGKGMAESKVQYVRQMVFQLLVCTETEVKAHIESALMALFRFSEEERAVIESRRKEDTQDALSSLASLWGSITTSN
jgi:hypothetical protein